MINHSGGCPGADMIWENEGKKYGIKSISYSFHNHVQNGENQRILTLEELAEGWEHIIIADQTLKRNVITIIYPYIKNLLCRNWFQVKNAESIFAIGKFINGGSNIVDGGTGWTVQMATDNDRDVFVFEQEYSNRWWKFDKEERKFKSFNLIPILTENFAGIGTRNINESGIAAIKKILKEFFE